MPATYRRYMAVVFCRNNLKKAMPLKLSINIEGKVAQLTKGNIIK